MQNIKIDATDSEGIRAALASYIAGMDTLDAMRVLTDAFDQVMGNANARDLSLIEGVDFDAIRDKRTGSRTVDTFNVLDHATHNLATYRDEPDDDEPHKCTFIVDPLERWLSA